MSRPKAYKGRCHCCGEWFEALRSNALLCSAKCRKRASRTKWGQQQPDDSPFFKKIFRYTQIYCGR